MAEYDVIVVGAGCAGSAAALRCARAGLKTLMLERGRYPGEKHLEIVGLWKSFLDDTADRTGPAQFRSACSYCSADIGDCS